MGKTKSITKQEKEHIFNEEFLPHADALYNFAYHLTYNDSFAQDLVQDTYLKAYRFIESYKQGTNAKAWLFRILKNGFINEYRKKSRQPNRVDFEEYNTYDDEAAGAPVQHLDLRDEIFQDMLGDEITKAINELPVDFRTVILLCDIEGFTYEEISKILEIPIGTVRSRLHRGRKQLQEKLKAYAIEMGYYTEKNNYEDSE